MIGLRVGCETDKGVGCGVSPGPPWDDGAAAGAGVPPAADC